MEAEERKSMEVQDIEEVDFGDIAQDSSTNVAGGALTMPPHSEEPEGLTDAQMDEIDKMTMQLDSLTENMKPPPVDLASLGLEALAGEDNATENALPQPQASPEKVESTASPEEEGLPPTELAKKPATGGTNNYHNFHNSNF